MPPITVRVRNFQSVEDATLVIDGLTVLTGTNNAGKSAFFRALWGAFANSRGHGFVRNGAPHCTVDVEFHDGNLQWEKGPKVNRYKVGTMSLSKVGHGPPAEVQALGVKSLSVGGQDIWPQIAPQLSGVQFLLNQPAPVLAEALADVDRVNHINRAIRLCEADRKQARSDLKAHDELHQSLVLQRQQFSRLDQDLAEFAAIEQEHAELSSLYSEIRDLEALRQRMRASQELLEALNGLEEIDLPSNEEVLQLRRLHQAVVVVAELSQRLSKARDDASKYANGDVLESLQAQVQALVVPIQELEQLAVQIRTLEQHHQRLVQHKEELRTCDLLLASAREAHASAVEKVKTMLGQFSECPTCGGKFHT